MLLRSALLLALLPLCFHEAAASAAERGELLKDEWMRIYFQDRRVGHSNSRTLKEVRDGHRFYVTILSQHLRIARAGVEMEFRISQRIEEDAEGAVTGFSRVLEQGPLRQKQTGRVEGGVLKMVTGEERDAVELTAPAPRGLGPMAAERAAKRHGYEAGTEYSIDVFMIEAPSAGSTANITIGEEERIGLYGVQKWLRRVETSFSIMPGAAAVSWVDAEGRVWLSEMAMGPFKFHMRRAPRHAALQPVGEGVPALAAAVKPDRPLPDPASLRSVDLRLMPVDSGARLPALPSDAFQHVEEIDGGLLVKLRRAEVDPGASYTLPYDGEAKRELLAATPWLEVESDIIREMAVSAAGGSVDAYSAARSIESFVHERVEDKRLDIGFATAAETARQMAGDCTEHAVLVAALARAAGIPSRVVVGLCYGGPLPGDSHRKFYYHMWAEVWVGEWLPLDAALGRHQLTGIAVARSGLSGPESIFDLTNTILELMGRFKVEVVDYR